MNITLNIGLQVSKHYLPDGVAEMHLQYEYVKDYLEKELGKPMQIGVAQSATEKTVVVEYTDVDLVLQKLFWMAHELKQDCIAYSVDYAGRKLGGALVGRHAYAWNYGIFHEAYFIHADVL